MALTPIKNTDINNSGKLGVNTAKLHAITSKPDKMLIKRRRAIESPAAK
ncbi:hypothetical protein P4S68_12455 [Pseudoalteromonas sp. Hal099]